MLISTLAFSLMNVCVKALPAIPTAQLITFRVGISLLITGALLYRAGMSPWGNNRVWLLVRGATGTCALWLYFITIKAMPLSTAVALQYISPLFAAILAPWFVGERMGLAQWLYFGISFIGVLFLKGFDANIGLVPLGLGLLSAFLTGITTNAIRRSKDTENPLVVMLYLPIFALPISLTFTIVQWVPPVGWQWALLLLTGLCTQVNQYYTTKALQTDRIDRVTYINYLGLVYAVIFGWAIFAEPITLANIGAMCLIVSGVLLNVLHGMRSIRRFRSHYHWVLRRGIMGQALIRRRHSRAVAAAPPGV